MKSRHILINTALLLNGRTQTTIVGNITEISHV